MFWGGGGATRLRGSRISFLKQKTGHVTTNLRNYQYAVRRCGKPACGAVLGGLM